MYLLKTLTILLATSVSASMRSFIDYMHVYNKTYESNVFINKYNNYINNIKLIDNHNNMNLSWKMGINKFTDMSQEDFSRNLKKSHLNFDKSKNMISYPFNTSVTDVPSDFDWSKKGMVTAVKNQGQCGSCWSFSASGAIESANAIKTGKLISLSEQQLMDCSSNYGNNGCNGGLMDDAFKYVMKNSLCTEQSYPYKATDNSCTPNDCEGVVKLSGYKDVTPNNEQALLQSLTQQPISIAIEADKYAFQFYKSGVFDGTCGTNLDHGVLLVGWGEVENNDNGVIKYWKVKNSWGPTWGDNGYILLARDIVDNRGQCGIAMTPSYPIIV